MNGSAIRVENLGKRYRIGGPRPAYRTLRESLADSLRGPVRRAGRLLRGQARRAADADETIWALRDVSVDVARGTVVGLIGRNGAGKTTLLKILSRITEPTEGRAEIRGRVGSLLEVGAGFHQELTGRENTYLNGAILGMRRREIDRKFDAIVEFAGIGKFLDTPVKRYSTGMYVRLAFAVAAHLDPDILIVDEILAVGDAAFQRKCLGRMGDIRGEGRTVVLTSHNMTSIVQLCDRVLWLDEGRVRMVDAPGKTVQAYLASGLAGTAGRAVLDGREGGGEVCFTSVELRNGEGEVTSDFDVLSPIRVDLAFRCARRLARLRLDAAVLRCDGIPLFSTTTQDYDSIPGEFAAGDHRARLEIPGRFLAAGEYYLNVNLCEPNVRDHDFRASVLRFRILGSPFRSPRDLGFLVCPFGWELVS